MLAQIIFESSQYDIGDYNEDDDDANMLECISLRTNKFSQLLSFEKKLPHPM